MSAHAEKHEQESPKVEGLKSSSGPVEYGIWPLLKETAGLAKGVLWEAPKHTVKTMQAANNTEHFKEEEDHPKEGATKEGEAKTDEKKEGEHKDGEAKETGHAHGHGHAKKKKKGFFGKLIPGEEGDLFAALGSVGDIWEKYKNGDLTQHDIEHGLDHFFDLADWELLRMPFVVKGVAKLAGFLGIPEHALETIPAKYDTLGEQILHELEPDKKGDFHHAVEGLCKSMSKFMLRSKFSKFLNKKAFEEALKTEAGKKELLAQSKRIFGDVLDLDRGSVEGISADLMERLQAPITGTPGHEHYHAHSLHNKKAKENHPILLEAIFNARQWLDESALKQIYHGEKSDSIKPDYDRLGDQLFEDVKTKGQRESFLKAFEEIPFKRAFRHLISDTKLDEAILGDPSEVQKQLNTLFDVTGTIDNAELIEQRDALIGKLGKRDDLDASLQAKYDQFKTFVDEITDRLTKGSPSRLTQLYATVITPRYGEFGKHVRELLSGKNPKGAKVGFLRGYNSELFRNEFPYLVDAGMLDNALKNDSERAEAQRQLLAFLGVNSKTVAYSQVLFSLKQFENFIGAEADLPPELQGTGKAHQIIKKDLSDATGVLTADKVKELFEGIKIETKWDEIGKQILNLKPKEVDGFLTELKPALFPAKFLTINSEDNLDLTAADPDKKDKAKKELAALYGTAVGEKLDAPSVQALSEAIKGQLKTSNPATYPTFIAFQKFIDGVTSKLTPARLSVIFA